jgi:DNA-binding transcriptional LysR family regulator/DNA-binding CsgD family transcriptional regulator
MSTLAAERTVRAGFAPALPLHLLLDFTRALRLRAPDVAVQVDHLVSVDQLTRLRGGELDLAIVFDPGEQPDLEREPLHAGALLVACLPAGHRLAALQVVRPDDVRGETLICGPRAMNPVVFDGAMARIAASGYRFRRLEQVSGITNRDIVFAVVLSRGMALLPASLEELAEAADDVVQRPIDPPLRLPPTCVAWRRHAAPGLSPVLGAVRSVAHELFEASRAPVQRGTEVLTSRQLDVLRLLADGKSTREIATELRLSETTVRNHIAGLMSALGVHTRLQAVITAKRAGLLDL